MWDASWFKADKGKAESTKNKSDFFLSCTKLFHSMILTSNIPCLSWMKTLTPSLIQGGCFPRGWKEQTGPALWQRSTDAAFKSGSEEREDYFPSQNGFATLPLICMVSQSCLNAARFITHLHTSPRISFLSRTAIQMPMPSCQGQIALSGERPSVVHSPTEIAVTTSYGSHWDHRSGGKKNQQNPFLSGLKFCSNGLREHLQDYVQQCHLMGLLKRVNKVMKYLQAWQATLGSFS